MISLLSVCVHDIYRAIQPACQDGNDPNHRALRRFLYEADCNLTTSVVQKSAVAAIN